MASLKVFSRVTQFSRRRNLLILPLIMGSAFSISQASSFKGLEINDENSAKLYYVTQEKGTERPFTGEHLKEKSPGEFSCVVCDEKIFDAKDKFESGSGWPSFFDVIAQDRVKLIEDKSHGMRRIEVVCSGCGSHLGHLFDDGPKPTGLRYCINSASINFEKNKNSKTGGDL